MPLGYNAEQLGYDSTQDLLVEGIQNYYIWPLLGLVYAALSLLFPSVFGLGVVQQVMSSSVDLIVLAVGITFVMAAGEIDLSIVGTMGVAPFITTWAITSLGVPMPLALLIVLPIICIIIGLANAFLVNTLEIDSLVATLGTYFFLIGAMLALTRGATVSGFGDAWSYIGTTSISGVPLLILSAFVIAIVAQIILSKHPFGQDLLLTGGDSESADKSGIDTDATRRNAFILAAILSGLAGFLLSSQLGIISSTFGQGRLLPAIAAPILGGVYLTGGKAQIHQAVGGALLLQMINTCLTIAGVSGYYIRLYTGILVLAAIVVGSLRIVTE
jgi:ribose/xylose/arabinose/galactoside ABC-type transport system permease subunit